MPYSYDRYTAAGGTSFAITFDYLSTDHIKVSLDGVEQAVDDDYSFTDATHIGFDSAPSSGVVVLIERNTPKTKAAFQAEIADFQDGSVLTESDLDNAVLGLLYVAQEAEDSGAFNALSRDLTDQKWDADSSAIKNLLDPTSGQEAVTKAYVDGLSLYNSPTAIDLYTFSGDGTTKTFAMAPDPGSTDSDSFFVVLDGVLQAPDKYTIASPNITFTTAPPDTEDGNIIVRNIGLKRDILATPLLADGSNANLPMQKSSGQTSNFLECTDTDGTTDLAKINISGGGVFSALTISGAAALSGGATVTGNVTVTGEVDAAVVDGEIMEMGLWTTAVDGSAGLMGNHSDAKGVVGVSTGGPFMQNGGANGMGRHHDDALVRGPYIQATQGGIRVGGKSTATDHPPAPINYYNADGFPDVAWSVLANADVPCKKQIDAQFSTTGRWLLLSNTVLDSTDGLTKVGSGFGDYDEVRIVFDNIRAKESGGATSALNLRLLDASDTTFALPYIHDDYWDSAGYFSTNGDTEGTSYDCLSFGSHNAEADGDMYNNFAFGQLEIKNNKLVSDSVVASRNVAYMHWEMGSTDRNNTTSEYTGSGLRGMNFTLRNDDEDTAQNTVIDKIELGFSSRYDGETGSLYGIVGTVKIYGFNYPTS